MAYFADINVSQDSVATYARCSGIFNMHLTANLPRTFQWNNFVNRLRFDRIWSLVCGPRFFGPTCRYEWHKESEENVERFHSVWRVVMLLYFVVNSNRRCNSLMAICQKNLGCPIAHWLSSLTCSKKTCGNRCATFLQDGCLCIYIRAVLFWQITLCYVWTDLSIVIYVALLWIAVVEYKIGDMGFIRYYLAPKIEDGEDAS